MNLRNFIEEHSNLLIITQPDSTDFLFKAIQNSMCLSRIQFPVQTSKAAVSIPPVRFTKKKMSSLNTV